MSLVTVSPLTSNIQVAPTSPPPPPGASLCLGWSHAERTQVRVAVNKQYRDMKNVMSNRTLIPGQYCWAGRLAEQDSKWREGRSQCERPRTYDKFYQKTPGNFQPSVSIRQHSITVTQTNCLFIFCKTLMLDLGLILTVT